MHRSHREIASFAALCTLALSPASPAQVSNGSFENEQVASVRDLFDNLGPIDACTNAPTYGCVPDTPGDGLTDRGIAIQIGTNATYANAPFYVYGNTAPATLADPIGTYLGRADQVFALQTVGTTGVGPFLRMVPAGWTLKRTLTPGAATAAGSGVNVVSAPSNRPVFLSPGLTMSAHTSEVANATGALVASSNNNEDAFIQLNTEANTVAGRFLAPATNNAQTLNSPSDWLAQGNNVLLVRNRNNKVLDSSAGIDQGRGAVLSQTTSINATAGQQLTLTWLVGDRIGALQLADYDVKARIGATEIFTTNSLTDNALRPFNDNSKTTSGSGATGTFREVSRTFTASTPGLVEISFGVGGAFAGASGTTAAGGLVAFDNIRLTAAVASLPGDANNDGKVDLLDLDILGANFGATGATLSQGDFNNDTTVNLLDLDILGANFGAMAATATAVPEPAALLLASALLLSAPAARRR